jgi:thiol-disulfide isomerase/thioredoxin
MIHRVALVLTAFLLSACGAPAQQEPSGAATDPVGVQRTPPAEREAAPVISGTTLDGDQLSLADYRGKTVVLNVWASWCAPCRKELPILAEAARKAGPDVRFVGLDVKDSTSRAIAMQDKNGVDYPSIVDEKGTWFAQLPWLPRALPGTVIIDPSGRVRATVIGPVTEQNLDALIG